MRKAFYRTVVAIAAMSPFSAFAQSEGRAPAGAVFGGVSTDSSRQTLNLKVDVDQAYDQNVSVRTGADALSLFQGSGSYTILTPNLDFSSRGDRVQLTATAGSDARYYSDVHQLLLTSQSVGAGLNVSLAPGSSISVNQGFTRAKSLLSGLFASAAPVALGGVVSPGSNYALNTNNTFASSTAAGLTHQVNARTGIALTANLEHNDSEQQSTFPSVRSHAGGGLVSYALSRRVKVKTGYTFKQARFEGSPQSTEHNFNVGIDYTRPLSRTRTTAFSISIGPAVISAPLTISSQDLLRQFRFIADASARYPLGRTWSIQGAYHRGMGYIEGFQTPVFTGAYAATVSGFFTRRTDLSVSAAYSSGESALTGTPSQFETYTGDVRFRYAVNRTWAAYVEYLFYYYNFDRDFAFTAGLPRGLTRNGLRSGVTMWLPVRNR